MDVEGKGNIGSNRKKGIKFNLKFYFFLFKLDFLYYLNVILLYLLYYSDIWNIVIV